MRSIRAERARPELVVLGLAGVAWATAFRFGALSVFGPTVVSVATCLVIYGAAQGAGFKPLGWAPLTWVGARSYGIYLWHPVVAVLVGQTLGRDVWWVYFPVLLAGSLLVAAASWRWLEEPCLRRRSGDAGDTAQELVRGDAQRAGAAIT
jgi:peptidoglycan/LPS O-acetylase OafA/YrhL